MPRSPDPFHPDPLHPDPLHPDTSTRQFPLAASDWDHNLPDPATLSLKDAAALLHLGPPLENIGREAIGRFLLNQPNDEREITCSELARALVFGEGALWCWMHVAGHVIQLGEEGPAFRTRHYKDPMRMILRHIPSLGLRLVPRTGAPLIREVNPTPRTAEGTTSGDFSDHDDTVLERFRNPVEEGQVLHLDQKSGERFIAMGLDHDMGARLRFLWAVEDTGACEAAADYVAQVMDGGAWRLLLDARREELRDSLREEIEKLEEERPWFTAENESPEPDDLPEGALAYWRYLGRWLRDLPYLVTDRLRIWLYLASMADSKLQVEDAYFKIKTNMNMGNTQIARVLRQLERAGFIERSRRDRNARKVITLLVPRSKGEKT